ncbi:MAG TPA: hypothetical protein VLY84_00130 [Dysgonamonadaceae bacterium]|nr:hypothetical protein [Dysgonamonadaceae bacterium]
MTKTYKPILYSTPMVEAIIDDLKSQTRRPINPQPKKQLKHVGMGYWSENPEDLKQAYVKAKYQVGDILWVRETFKKTDYTISGYTYKAHGHPEMPKTGWKPSIHMPKKAARLFLEVIAVRVEPLRNILHYDARQEGVKFIDGLSSKKFYYNYLTLDFRCNELYSFMTLWQSIYGEDSWLENPWVWVYEFKRIERPVDFI